MLHCSRSRSSQSVALIVVHTGIYQVAANSGHNEAVRLLLDAGADILHLDKKGRNCAMKAALEGKLQTLKLLHERGVSIDIFDSYGTNAAHMAAKPFGLSLIHI